MSIATQSRGTPFFLDLGRAHVWCFSGVGRRVRRSRWGMQCAQPLWRFMALSSGTARQGTALRCDRFFSELPPGFVSARLRCEEWRTATHLARSGLGGGLVAQLGAHTWISSGVCDARALSCCLALNRHNVLVWLASSSARPISCGARLVAGVGGRIACGPRLGSRHRRARR